MLYPLSEGLFDLPVGPQSLKQSFCAAELHEMVANRNRFQLLYLLS